MSSAISDKYLTIGPGSYTSEIKVQGSRFIARMRYVANRNSAQDIYNDIRKKYYNATHNCYAYRIDDNDFRFSDDGEPSGTAGKPILQVLEGYNLFYCLAVVTRYFGGTKLGTGGLIRAYTDATKSVLEKVKIIEKIHYREFKLIMAYENLRDVQDLISRYHGKIVASEYGEKITLGCQIPFSWYKAFQEAIIHKIEIKDA
jgi:uncharacterized YigZ family protein